MRDRFSVKSKLREYEVHFVSDCIRMLGPAMETSFYLVDRRVMELYGRRLEPVLPAERMVLIEAAESHKTIDYCQHIIAILMEGNVRKNWTLVAIGGGIIQDITAFIATILFRGVNWVFYPTTLLAQADSCIGSKTSLNLGKYKNLLGTFYPPSQVYIDGTFLQTLPVAEIKSGIGEILHFYLVNGNAPTQNLIDEYDKLIADPLLLVSHIRTSLEIKRKMVEIDEYDQNERNLFNYGHTFGHAIESISGFGVSHGQAVTMGMDIANYLSVEFGYLERDSFMEMHQIISKNMPTFKVEPYKLEEYFLALSKDKKNSCGHLTCILISGPGFMKKVQLPFDNKLKANLASYFKDPTFVDQGSLL